MKWSFTVAQTEALKEFLFENNFDRTPLRETCFRKGYEMGFAQAQSELTHIAGAQEEAAIKDKVIKYLKQQFLYVESGNVHIRDMTIDIRREFGMSENEKHIPESLIEELAKGKV